MTVNPFAALVLGDIDAVVIPIIVLSGGVIIVLVSIVSSALTSILTNRQSERTRREIAAYVAEGSMTPDEGARLIAAAPSKRRGPIVPGVPDIPGVPSTPRSACCMKHA